MSAIESRDEVELTPPAETVEEIVGALQAEAARLGFSFTLRPGAERYTELGGLVLPIKIEGVADLAGEIAAMDALWYFWNSQEPEPRRYVSITFSWNPEVSLLSTPP